MKKWYFSLIMLIAISCNKTSIDPIPKICNDSSVFEFSNTEVAIAGNGRKFTYNSAGDLVGIDDGKMANFTYNLKYDKSSLTLFSTSLSTKDVSPFVFQLNENNSVKSYESRRLVETGINGLYEYDNENRLVKFSLTYTSISSPQYTQTDSFIIDWKDGKINEIRKYFNYNNQWDNLQWRKVFEYQVAETTNTDNFYNLVFFGDASEMNFERYMGLSDIGIRRGVMPKNLPVRYRYILDSGDDFGGGEYSYKFDEYKRITNVKISHSSSLPRNFSFNYLCH